MNTFDLQQKNGQTLYPKITTMVDVVGTTTSAMHSANSLSQQFVRSLRGAYQRPRNRRAAISTLQLLKKKASSARTQLEAQNNLLENNPGRSNDEMARMATERKLNDTLDLLDDVDGVLQRLERDQGTTCCKAFPLTLTEDLEKVSKKLDEISNGIEFLSSYISKQEQKEEIQSIESNMDMRRMLNSVSPPGIPLEVYLKRLLNFFSAERLLRQALNAHYRHTQIQHSPKSSSDSRCPLHSVHGLRNNQPNQNDSSNTSSHDLKKRSNLNSLSKPFFPQNECSSQSPAFSFDMRSEQFNPSSPYFNENLRYQQSHLDDETYFDGSFGHNNWFLIGAFPIVMIPVSFITPFIWWFTPLEHQVPCT